MCVHQHYRRTTIKGHFDFPTHTNEVSIKDILGPSANASAFRDNSNSAGIRFTVFVIRRDAHQNNTKMKQRKPGFTLNMPCRQSWVRLCVTGSGGMKPRNPTAPAVHECHNDTRNNQAPGEKKENRGDVAAVSMSNSWKKITDKSVATRSRSQVAFRD